MSNKSGTVGQAISLPQGGGALQGIGEKFSPDLYTGTGNFTVPIALPPGRNGFQPQLSLVYSTGNGNGPFGLGWSLSVPGVTLKTSKGIPRYHGDDTYILSGAEDLVLVQEEPVSSSAIGWSWGYNAFGDLGDGSTTNRSTPGQVSSLKGVTAVAAGGNHTLALTAEGTVWAWGCNASGQLGNGTTNDQLTPVRVSGLGGVAAVAAGMNHSLAFKADGTVWAWGRNNTGQLGIGTTDDRLTPVRVGGLSGVVAVAAGSGWSFALRADGTVWAWGGNDFGTVGDGTRTTRLTPVQVSGLTGVVAIAGGGGHSLALKADGTVWAWGFNAYGTCGDGTEGDARPTIRDTPAQVTNLSGVVAIAGAAGTAWRSRPTARCGPGG